MITQVEKDQFKNFVLDLETACQIRKDSRRRIFKFLRKHIDSLRDSSTWVCGKISRGYSSDVRDSQLTEACKRFIKRSF